MGVNCRRGCVRDAAPYGKLYRAVVGIGIPDDPCVILFYKITGRGTAPPLHWRMKTKKGGFRLPFGG